MYEGPDVWNYILGAYGVAWVGLVGYAVRLWVVNRRAAAAARDAAGGSA